MAPRQGSRPRPYKPPGSYQCEQRLKIFSNFNKECDNMLLTASGLPVALDTAFDRSAASCDDDTRSPGTAGRGQAQQAEIAAHQQAGNYLHPGMQHCKSVCLQSMHQTRLQQRGATTAAVPPPPRCEYTAGLPLQ